MEREQGAAEASPPGEVKEGPRVFESNRAFKPSSGQTLLGPSPTSQSKLSRLVSLFSAHKFFSSLEPIEKVPQAFLKEEATTNRTKKTRTLVCSTTVPGNYCRRKDVRNERDGMLKFYSTEKNT